MRPSLGYQERRGVLGRVSSLGHDQALRLYPGATAGIARGRGVDTGVRHEETRKEGTTSRFWRELGVVHALSPVPCFTLCYCVGDLLSPGAPVLN